MENDLINKKDKLVSESAVIPDECGDSMWDAVLQQEINACEVNKIHKAVTSLLNKIDLEKVSDSSVA